MNSAFGVIPEKLDNYESTADLPAFDLDGMNPYFMYFVAIQESFYLKHGSIADGSRKAKRIHADTFLNMPVMVPTIDEQNLIVDFLQHLDNLTTLHQCKYNYLLRLKDCIFSIIVKTTWEQRKLGELALFNPKDELPQIFEYVDLESVVGTEMLSHRTEIKSSAPSRAQRIARTGDLFYQTVRPYQKNNYLFEKPDNNYVFSTGYAQMRPFVDGYFMLSLVQSERFIKVVLDNCTGTSYPAINSNNLAEIEVYAPSNKKEDNKIGTIFRNIDNLITLHQCKLKLLKQIKQSMENRLFIKNTTKKSEGVRKYDL